MTDVIRSIRVHKTQRLMHKDNFIKRAVKESVANIKLANRPRARDNQGKNDTDSDRLDNGTKGFSEVNPRDMMKTFGDQARLILVHQNHPGFV